MKSHIRTLALSAAAGVLAAWLLAAFGGPAPSAHLAQQLRLGSGYLLAAILGGLLGLWLALGRGRAGGEQRRRGLGCSPYSPTRVPPPYQKYLPVVRISPTMPCAARRACNSSGA